jgi:DNA-binding response OmpR family regulator
MTKQKTILFVDDDEDILYLNKITLERGHYEVLTANSITEARAKLSHQPDVIVLDISLPDGNGIDFCREVRKTMSVPILFLSALTETKTQREGLTAGGNGYITKPYDMKRLQKRIAAII